MRNSLELITQDIYSFLLTITVLNPYALDTFVSLAAEYTSIKLLREGNPYLYIICGIPFDNPNFKEFIQESIYVNPFDSYTSVKLTAENMVNNPDIWAYYRDNIDNFKQLLGAYPAQSGYVKACIYPVRAEARTWTEPGHPVNVNTGYLSDLTPEELDVLRWNIDNSLVTILSQIQLNTHVARDLKEKAIATIHVLNTVYGVDLIYASTIATKYKLVSWATNVLESHELDSCVLAIHTYLDTFVSKWDVPQYIAHEKYSGMVMYLSMLAQLPIVIDRQRVENLKTDRVHTFFIWEYLLSQGISDYRDVLDRDQAMYLYKNIVYLKQSRGTVESLKLLFANLLEPYGMTLDMLSLVMVGNEMETTCRATPKLVATDISTDSRILTPFVHALKDFNSVFRDEQFSGLERANNDAVYHQQLLTLEQTQVSSEPTKLLQLNAGSKITSQEFEFSNFAFETFIKAAIEKRISYNVEVAGNLGTPITLDICSAIALSYYLAKNAASLPVWITAHAPDDIVNKYYLFHTDRVFITINNISDYDGDRLICLGPTPFPNKVGINRAYKQEYDIPKIYPYDQGTGDEIVDSQINKFTLEPEIDIGTGERIVPPTGEDLIFRSQLNSEFTVDGSELNIRYVLGKMFYKERYLAECDSATELITSITELFDMRIEDASMADICTSVTHDIACNLLYSQILDDGVRDMDLLPEFDTFEDWFDATPGMWDFITSLDRSNLRNVVYGNELLELVGQMVPLAESKHFSDLIDKRAKNALLQDLFMELCSYDVAFLSPLDDFVYTTPATIDGATDVDGFTPTLKVVVVDDTAFSDDDTVGGTEAYTPNLAPPTVYADAPAPVTDPMPVLGTEITMEIDPRADSEDMGFASGIRVLPPAELEADTASFKPTALTVNKVSLVGQIIRTTTFTIGELIDPTSNLNDTVTCHINDDILLRDVGDVDREMGLPPEILVVADDEADLDMYCGDCDMDDVLCSTDDAHCDATSDTQCALCDADDYICSSQDTWCEASSDSWKCDACDTNDIDGFVCAPASDANPNYCDTTIDYDRCNACDTNDLDPTLEDEYIYEDGNGPEGACTVPDVEFIENPNWTHFDAPEGTDELYDESTGEYTYRCANDDYPEMENPDYVGDRTMIMNPAYVSNSSFCSDADDWIYESCDVNSDLACIACDGTTDQEALICADATDFISYCEDKDDYDRSAYKCDPAIDINADYCNAATDTACGRCDAADTIDGGCGNSVDTVCHTYDYAYIWIQACEGTEDHVCINNDEYGCETVDTYEP